MKLDTSEPKDWKAFVNDLNLSGVQKLLLQHCRVYSWYFPRINLIIDSANKPFISKERIESLEKIFNERYECNNIKIGLLVVCPYEHNVSHCTSDNFVELIKIINPNCKEESPMEKKRTLDEIRSIQIEEALRMMSELVEYTYDIACELEAIKHKLKDGLAVYSCEL